MITHTHTRHALFSYTLVASCLKRSLKLIAPALFIFCPCPCASKIIANFPIVLCYCCLILFSCSKDYLTPIIYIFYRETQGGEKTIAHKNIIGCIFQLSSSFETLSVFVLLCATNVTRKIGSPPFAFTTIYECVLYVCSLSVSYAMSNAYFA